MKLKRGFYTQEAEIVAKSLIGCILHVKRGAQVIKARIVETEAYVGEHDKACHTSRGRTARTEVMFGEGGHIYIYFIYGMHYMLNIVTGPKDCGQAVLIRAAEAITPRDLDLSGPGKLTRALKIAKRENGLSLLSSRIFIKRGSAPKKIGRSSRIGIDYAGPKWRAAKLRFFDPESLSVSSRKAR